MKGYVVGILELSLFMFGSIFIRRSFHQLQSINKITYFWVMMTILTGIWEIAYISDYSHVVNMSSQLIKNKQHVWTNDIYNISYVLPWKLSHIFYSEYGAWADREYMSNSDDWSRIIESSHCTQCALCSLIAVIFKIFDNHNNYLISLSVSMGTQFMNSFLYMFAYFIQENDPNNANYANSTFPSDTWLIKRPFMWVNILWLVMPFYTISYYLLENWNTKNNKNSSNSYKNVKSLYHPPPYLDSEYNEIEKDSSMKSVYNSSDNSFILNTNDNQHTFRIGNYSKYTNEDGNDTKKSEKDEFNVGLKSPENEIFKLKI